MPAEYDVRAWLDSRTEEQLQALLESRPDLSRGAPVRDLDDLARRLRHPSSVYSLLLSLPSPAVQVLEAVAALGTRATLEELTALLDAGARDDDEQRRAVLHWLHGLEAVALVWQDGERWTPNPGVHGVLIAPLLMGPPASVLARELNVDRLRRLYSAFGVAPPARKAELVAGLDELYADASRIRKIVAEAPPRVVESLTRYADECARASMSGARSREDEEEEYWSAEAQRRLREEMERNRWALDEGLAFGAGGTSYAYGYTPVQYPAEVLLALVPPTYRAPFQPEPPALLTARVSVEQTERDSAAAITGLLAAQMAVLELTLRAPVKLLKSGGVGARELTRIAKGVGVSTAEVRLALELGASLRFYPRGPDLRAGGEFEAWRSRSPAERATDLVLAWWRETAPPTRERDAEGKARPALAEVHHGGPPAAAMVISLLIGLEEGAVTGLEPVLDQLAWAHPLVELDTEDLRCAWDEASRFGVVRDGRLTRLGRAVLTGDREPVRSVLEELLPAESGEVLFGSDLTVVVPGSPGAAVVDLLDTVAVRESHGVGASWRVSEDSVRQALDRGYTVDVLLAELREVAGRALPQPLEYLLRDVERRHGRIGVRPAACVVVSDDESLVAELAATRVLRSLGLTAVAPTVLLGTKDVPTTLAALRKAGYLPVEQEAGGTLTVQVRSRGPVAERSPEPKEATGPEEQTTEQQTTEEDWAALLELPPGQPVVPRSAQRTRYRREEPAELAARLRAGGPPPEAVVDPGVLAQVEGWGRRLLPEEVRHLAHAVTAGEPVLIRYRNENGNETDRKVSRPQVSGGYLTGYCHLRHDERFFRLDRILSILPLS